MGTLLGALIYFRRDIARYLSAWVRSIRTRSISTTDERLAWALVLGTIPGVIIGALFESVIQEHLGQPWLIAVMLAVFGVVLYVVDRRAPSTRTIDDVTPRRGLLLGVAQAVALQPGVSRSGVTMTAGRLLKLDRADAARFSFLLALPITAGAGVYKGIDVMQSGFQGYASEFFWGFVASGVSGFVVIAWLLRYLRTRDFKIFMIYRLVVAAIVVAAILAGRPAGGL
jgi:undecaprenyl-diphosphatase